VLAKAATWKRKSVKRLIRSISLFSISLFTGGIRRVSIGRKTESGQPVGIPIQYIPTAAETTARDTFLV
jgi:hypothetical protein